MSDKVENTICDEEGVSTISVVDSAKKHQNRQQDDVVEKHQDDEMECDSVIEKDKKIESNELESLRETAKDAEKEPDDKMGCDSMIEKEIEPNEKKSVPETGERTVTKVDQDDKMDCDSVIEKEIEPNEIKSVPGTGEGTVDKEPDDEKESDMGKKIEPNEDIVKATIPDEEQIAVKVVETEKSTDNKVLEQTSAQDAAEKTKEVITDDANDSQESMELVIDEKNDNQEITEENKPSDDNKPEDEKADEDITKCPIEEEKNIVEPTKKTEAECSVEKDKDRAGPAKETELKNGEGTSEMSVPTQIDLTEVNSVVTESNDGEEESVQLVPAEDIAKNIIEIDDETEEDVAKEKDSQEPEAECTEKPQTSEMGTVIEIDDDDDEEPVTDETSSKMETLKQDAKEGDADAKVGPTAQKVDELVDVVEKSLAVSTDDKDVNSKAASATETENPDAIVLEEAKPRPVSTSPTPAEVNLAMATDEVFYNKECLNYDCPRKHKQYFRVSQFVLSYFKVTKKKFKPQYVCGECYDKALDMYEEFCGALNAKQPLLLQDIVGGRQEFVEIIDSSDEEDTDDKADKEKESPSFSKADLDLIAKELENSIKTVLDKVEIQNQLTWSKTILATRVKKLEEETNYIDAELRSLQKKADNMHVSLYQCPKIKIRQLQPLDLNSGRPYVTGDTELPQLPPVGEIHRPSIQINESYFAVKNKAIASWVPCKVTEQVADHIAQMMAQKNLKHYKIKFLKSQYQMLKTVSVKHLAYFNPPPVRLPIATRVIAYFDATSLSRGKEKMMIQSAFYPGIIAEPLKPNNKYRYLIFYDDGYTQYVYHKDVRLVCHVSENVWEDVHPGSRDFIQKYLTQYSINRPMVQTQKGQSMTTESNGKWIYARVVDIDCSLIQMQFEGPKSHTEWIYRGSMRLGPVFKEYQKTQQKDAMPISRLPRRTEPFIRYTEDEEATSNQQNERTSEARAVAKKSVSRQESTTSSLPPPQAQTPVKTVRHLNNSTIYVEDENKPKGKVVYYTAKRNLNPRVYTPHTCSPACLFQITHNLSAYSPLSKPLLSGWERMIMRQKVKKIITYRSPCGLILRNMNELHSYLRATHNSLNVDNFDFSHETNCLAEYVIESAIVQKRDISLGQEKMPIPLVNYYDSTMPPECRYAAQRIPTEGVNLNLDEEFLVGCDCEDDCSDKSKCSCWQLTQNGAKYGNPNTPANEIGYQYKRLYDHVPTGIYECNSRCKCKSNCLNRVVQQSLQMKLQVFKTSNRGWGLRCLNDVPRGSFICIYAGHLLTEAKANEGGLDAGDEYFAELDYIEVAEQIKEGYESDVDPPELDEEEEDYAPDQDDDDEFTPSKSFITRARNKSKSARLNPPSNGEDDSQERQVINFNPNADMNENSMRESSIRQLFGKDEACYVMDAKTIGNLGRYFNHSCSPNLFVQNVFVDTHDLRFPWVAFFALSHIRSGTELTWNYNYEVGVVPGKVLYCQCGAPNCRLRLL